LGSLQLQRAKQQLIGQIAMAQESNVSELLSMAKSLLVFDKVDSIHEVNREIEQITAEDLLAISNECFDEKQFSTLIYNGQK
jgi:predicted Zn-dependent peptidase